MTQRCLPPVVVKGKSGQSAKAGVCVALDNAFMTVTAPAECGRGACDTSGTWRMKRSGRDVASGEFGRRAGYPGPGTYEIITTLRVRSVPAGVDLRAERTARITLSWPRPKTTHRIDVSPRTVRAGRTTTVTYTVSRLGPDGDSNSRLGLIGTEGTGVRLTSSDPQCSNPLSGAYPSTARHPYVLNCDLVNLQPGRPNVVKVRVRMGKVCSPVVSKMGYWLPKGQEAYTGNMLVGPTVGCVKG
ncbi:hypothetical protein [Streptomyces hiroshimensis]|uniref:hypothetical protein n=1 Tax=Streptomyces hiroshimensis TaxID=66424 RepID=UPI00167A2EF0|nr:hypothetical protein [Streptomyces hiroshimensis]